MRRHETDPSQSLNGFQHPEKLCEGYRFLQCLSIGIHILSQKHNFRDAVSYKAFHFFYDCLRTAASLTAPHIGYDTVTAEIIAAEHDIDA